MKFQKIILLQNEILTSVLFCIGVDGLDTGIFVPVTAAAVAETTPGSVETTSSSNFFRLIAR